MTERFKKKCDDLVRRVVKARTQAAQETARAVDRDAVTRCGRLSGPITFTPKKERS